MVLVFIILYKEETPLIVKGGRDLEIFGSGLLE